MLELVMGSVFLSSACVSYDVSFSTTLNVIWVLCNVVVTLDLEFSDFL